MGTELGKKYFIVAIITLSLVVDNILLTVILPGFPVDFYIETERHGAIANYTADKIDKSGSSNCTSGNFLLSENIYFGLLVAAKPFVQFIVAALIGPFVNRCGYDVPMFIGFGIIIASSLVFGYGITYVVLFMARSFQGIGSACIDVASFAMVANMFDNLDQRSKMLAFVLSGYGFGILIGPPFGSFTYITAGKAAPFIIIACFTAILAVAYLFSHKISILVSQDKKETHIKMLLTDPYVMMCALAVGVSTLAVSVLATGQPLWMMKTMCPKKWMLGNIGEIWYSYSPRFLREPLLGVAYLPECLSFLATLLILPFIFPNSHHWLALAIGMAVLGISTILLPFATSVWLLVGPGTFFGLALATVGYSILLILSEVVDQRHLPGMFEKTFLMLNLIFCLTYILGCFLSSTLLALIGYKAMVVSVGVFTFICFPIGIYLQDPPSRDQSTLQRLLGYHAK